MLLFWYVSLSVLLWTIVYMLINIVNKNKSTEWNCRIVAMIHAFIVTKTIEVSFFIERNPFYHVGEQNTIMQNIALTISAGFFVFDFAWSVYMGTEGVLMLSHHVISILSLIGGLMLDHSGSEIVITLWGAELTNPFLQTRWFLRETKQYNTMFGAFNDFTFFIIFFIARIVIGTGLAMTFFTSKKTVLIMKIGGFIFFSISVIWMWQIWKFAKKRNFSGKNFLKGEK